MIIDKCPYCFDDMLSYIKNNVDPKYIQSPLFLINQTNYGEGINGFKYQCQRCRLTFELRTRNNMYIWIYNEDINRYASYLESKGYYVIPTKHIVSDRKTRNGILIEPINKNEILRKQNNKCVYCKTDLSKTEKHLDHIVPISKGGAEIQENMQYLCRACNLDKRDEISEKWNNVQLYESMKKRGLLHYHIKKIR